MELSRGGRPGELGHQRADAGATEGQGGSVALDRTPPGRGPFRLAKTGIYADFAGMSCADDRSRGFDAGLGNGARGG